MSWEPGPSLSPWHVHESSGHQGSCWAVPAPGRGQRGTSPECQRHLTAACHGPGSQLALLELPWLPPAGNATHTFRGSSKSHLRIPTLSRQPRAGRGSPVGAVSLCWGWLKRSSAPTGHLGSPEHPPCSQTAGYPCRGSQPSRGLLAQPRGCTHRDPEGCSPQTPTAKRRLRLPGAAPRSLRDRSAGEMSEHQ